MSSEKDEMIEAFYDPYYDTTGMVWSKDKVDKRLIDIYKIKKVRDVVLNQSNKRN